MTSFKNTNMLFLIICIYPENLFPFTHAQNVQVFVQAENLKLKFLLKKTPKVAEDKYVVFVLSLQNFKAYCVVEVKLLLLLTSS